MIEPSFSGLLVVVSVAFAAPFLLGLLPAVKLPAVVLEILAGIAIGPAVLGTLREETLPAGAADALLAEFRTWKLARG